MRKAGSKATLAGLALALAGLLNCLAQPVYAQRRATARAGATLNAQAARPHPGAIVLADPGATLPNNSKQQDEAPLAPAVTKIAFASNRDGNYEIYSMDSDGGAQTRLTDNGDEDLAPAWSPDGTRIAFVSNRDGNNEIYVMGADGTNQTRLTNSTADDLDPTWSPDGTKIAFVSNRDGNNEIYTMNPDGSGQVNLTNNPYEDVSPAYSPSGTMLAFSSNRPALKFQIFRMNSDGSGVTQLTFTADANDFNPSWSPSAAITFQSDRDGNDEIYTFNANSGLQNLSNNPAFDVEPARSSDGSKVVFASARGDNFDIFIMNADGTNQTQLTTSPGNDIQPAIQATGTIPPPPGPGATTIQFSAADFSVDEGGRRAVITVTRTGNTTGASTVEYGTSPGTATNRSDYIFAFGKLRFLPGETTKTFGVLIVDDVYIEPDETITLFLSKPTNASLGPQSAATLTILDNDSATPTRSTNPIDNATFFVQQQYFDFLSREPDAAGLAFWVGRINECRDPACVERRRYEVSAAFFIEQEYQQTAFFVYRLYRAAYGMRPTYQQFIRDRSRVIDGPDLAQNKLDLLNDFVERDEFKQVYPDTLTPEQFVNKLFDMATLFPFTAERAQLAAELRSGAKTRAQVLNAVIEIAAFKTREFNPAFVFSQYAGYLQRDPDPGGFAFWLDVISNRDVNNYLGMVQAFITSQEYRRRFGPS